MEEQIKQTAAGLKYMYGFFWLLAVVLVIAGECGGIWIGAWASDAQKVYVAETLSILSSFICVPVSLKLFAWVLVHKIDAATLPVALKLYSRWSLVRLVLLLFPVIVGFVTYYQAMSTKGFLCAMIALTASFFCVPGEKRLRRELNIDEE